MNITKKTTLIVLGITLGMAASVLAASWQNTDWIASGNVIDASKTKENFDYLYERSWDKVGSDISYQTGNIKGNNIILTGKGASAATTLLDPDPTLVTKGYMEALIGDIEVNVTNLTTNTTNIDNSVQNLTTQVTNNTTEVTNLTTQVTNNTTEITNVKNIKTNHPVNVCTGNQFLQWDGTKFNCKPIVIRPNCTIKARSRWADQSARGYGSVHLTKAGGQEGGVYASSGQWTEWLTTGKGASTKSIFTQFKIDCY